MTVSIAKAKTLCNANELALVTASTRQQIGEFSAARLRQKVTRARKLRDKWRDQAERQRRAAQQRQQARQTSASARSAKKAELFAEVLERFEKRLAKVSDKATGGGRVRKTPPRKVRAKQHRASRAELRDSLDQTRRAMGAAGKKRAPKKRPSSSAKPAEPEQSAPAPAADESAGKKPKQGPPPAGSSRTMSGLSAAQGLKTTKRKQRRVQTVAKQSRFKAAGAVRIQKHLSARTKRRQARRDSR